MAAKGEFTVTTVITRGGHAGQPALVLAEPDGNSWRLPVFSVSEVPDGRALAPALRAAAAQRFGLAVATLSLIHTTRGPESERQSAVVALDAYTTPKDGTEPAASAWIAPDDLPDDALPGGELTDRVRAWLAELQAGKGHPLREPWARPGWLAEATAWIEDQLAQQGLELASPIEQQRTWSLSSLLRVPLADGGAYFKALPAYFGAEPTLTWALANRFPDQVPAVVAYDPERAWLLMRAFAGERLQDLGELRVWQAALRDYARLQMATVQDAPALLRLGCRDRRLDHLPAQLAQVLVEAEQLEPGEDGSLRAEQLEELRELAPRLPEACAALEACGVPYSLEHGDLHGNNVAVTATGFVFFDWSDACLAHPFTCLTTFLETAPEAWQAPLISAYAAEWDRFAEPEDLARAIRLARPLGAAHLAVSYHAILAGTEPSQRWQLAGALPFFLREVLKYKEALTPH